VRIVCFPHGYYLSEVSRLLEIGRALHARGEEVVFLGHGGAYEHLVQEAGFELVSVDPVVSPERAADYLAFNRGDRGTPSGRASSPGTNSARTFRRRCTPSARGADAVLIGWNLPSCLSAPLPGFPIIVEQPGPLTAPSSIGTWGSSNRRCSGQLVTCRSTGWSTGGCHGRGSG
jgi:hypothetical protein